VDDFESRARRAAPAGSGVWMQQGTEMLTGIADVFRGTENLGGVQYQVTIKPDNRVDGFVVHLERKDRPAAARRVPLTFLPQQVAVAADLSLTLPDGRRIEFMVPSTDGWIINGRVVAVTG
jgi:hypothetical protein